MKETINRTISSNNRVGNEELFSSLPSHTTARKKEGTFTGALLKHFN